MAQATPANNQPRQVEVINPDRQVSIIRFSPCGLLLAAGGDDATVRRWEVTDRAFTAIPSLTGHRGWVQGLAFHPDRRRLFTADSWGEIRCWTYTERQTGPSRIIPAAHEGWIRELAISSDGRLLATCGRDQKVCLWSVDDGRKLHEMTEHQGDVFSVAFHPDGRSLVSGDLLGSVKQWDVATGRKTRELDCRALCRQYRLNELGGARRLVFDAAGRTLACAGGRPGENGAVPTMLLFDWATGSVRHTMSVGDPNSGYVFDLAFHASGFIMAVSSGQPGNGRFYLHRPGEAAPFFVTTAMPNCHSLAAHPGSNRVVVSATNGGSNGNGRPLNNGEYPGNFSPLHVWTIPS